jgi:hypothetical protein
LVLFINPPSGILFIFILGTLTLLIGMALAWAWGVITMKAALAARPQTETLARLQMLGQEAARQANATGQSAASLQSQLVYDGFMLDARVSVIYFVMTCVFIYFLVRLPSFCNYQVTNMKRPGCAPQIPSSHSSRSSGPSLPICF